LGLHGVDLCISTMRSLRKNEQDLIRFMLKDITDQKNFIDELTNIQVQEMNDGGMGSLKFLTEKEGKRIYKKDISIMHYKDIDGISVMFSLNVDMDDDVYELDVFKGDFSPLRKFPVAPYPPVEPNAQ
jgi:hypothetical protein